MACVKVSYGNEKLVVPLGSTTSRVRLLLEKITTRLRAHTGKSAEDLRLVQITTQDGYLIDLEDVVGDVIAPGQSVVVVDYNTWVVQQSKLLGSAWAKIVRADYEASTTFYLQIGLHQFGHLYISFYQGNKLAHLELVPVARLLSFDKAGEHAIFSLGKKGSWHAEAKFVVKMIGDAFVASAVVLELQASSDPQPEILEVSLKSEDNALAMDTAVVKQKARQYRAPKDLTFAPLKQDSYTGPKLPDVIPAVASKSFQGNVSLISDTSATLQIEQLEDVVVEENWRNNDGTFFSLYHTLVRVTNVGTKNAVLSKVDSEYLDKSGKVVTVDYTRLGNKAGYYNYSYSEPPYNVALAPEDSMVVSIRSSIKVKSLQLERSRRIHPSLPRPLKLKLKLYGNDNRFSTLDVEVPFEAYQLATKENVEEQNKKSYLWMLTVDDADLEERLWVAASVTAENQIELSHQSRNQRIYLDQTALFRYGYQAAKDNSSEVALDWKWENGPEMFLKAWLLVDLKSKIPYAVRVNIQSSTSYGTFERLLPELKVASEEDS